MKQPTSARRTSRKSSAEKGKRTSRENTNSRYRGGLSARRVRRRAHPVDLYMQRLKPGSHRTMMSSLRSVVSYLTRQKRADVYSFQWHRMSYRRAMKVYAHWSEHYAPSTARKVLAGLKGVLRECWRLGMMKKETLERLTDLPGISGDRTAAGRRVSHEEMASLVDACRDGTPLGVRDAAIVALLYVGGLRRSELVTLDMVQLDLQRGTVRVIGKRNRERVVPLNADAVDFLEEWVETRGDTPGPLFLPAGRNGWMSRPMSPAAVWKMLQVRAAAAEIDQVSPHDLRRTCCSDLLEAGEDLSTAQRYLGHRDISTTAIYDRRGDETLRRAGRALRIGRKR